MYASQSWVKELVTRLFKKNNEYMLSKTCNYSLEEQVVGTWIDGKPLYQKTINLGTNYAIRSNTSINVDISNENIANIISSSIIISSSNSFDSGVCNVDAWLNSTGFTFYCKVDWNAHSYRTVYFTIQYTKTTN